MSSTARRKRESAGQQCDGAVAQPVSGSSRRSLEIFAVAEPAGVCRSSLCVRPTHPMGGRNEVDRDRRPISPELTAWGAERTIDIMRHSLLILTLLSVAACGPDPTNLSQPDLRVRDLAMMQPNEC